MNKQKEATICTLSLYLTAGTKKLFVKNSNNLGQFNQCHLERTSKESIALFAIMIRRIFKLGLSQRPKQQSQCTRCRLRENSSMQGFIKIRQKDKPTQTSSNMKRCHLSRISRSMSRIFRQASRKKTFSNSLDHLEIFRLSIFSKHMPWWLMRILSKPRQL